MNTNSFFGFGVSSLALIFFGFLLVCLSYTSVEPLFSLIFITLLATSFLYLLSNRSKRLEFFCATYIYSVCIFSVGISSIYMNFFGDIQYKPGKDSLLFFNLAKGEYFLNPISTFMKTYDGIGAVTIWKFIYNFFSLLGFEKLPYIGLATNSLFVTLSGFLSIKAVSTLYPNDSRRLIRFTMLFSSCGLVLLFSSLHLRDSFVLFVVTLQLYFWLRFINLSNLVNLSLLTVISLFSFYFLLYLRAEFVILPIGFLLAYLASNIQASRIWDSIKSFRFIFSTLIFTFGLIYFLTSTSIFSDLYDVYELYFATSGKDESSLGYSLIISQPFPIRLVLGFVYILVFPIPFWSGIDLQSAYFLYKSLNAILFYFLIPLLILSFLNIYKIKQLRTVENMFLLFCLLGFTSAVVMTSSETRHIGAFISVFLLFSLIPSLSKRIEIKNYVTILACFLSLICVVHIAWIFLTYL